MYKFITHFLYYIIGKLIKLKKFNTFIYQLYINFLKNQTFKKNAFKYG